MTSCLECTSPNATCFRLSLIFSPSEAQVRADFLQPAHHQYIGLVPFLLQVIVSLWQWSHWRSLVFKCTKKANAKFVLMIVPRFWSRDFPISTNSSLKILYPYKIWELKFLWNVENNLNAGLLIFVHVHIHFYVRLWTIMTKTTVAISCINIWDVAPVQ